MIECFGPERCMFESNFPVDRFSLSYRTLWNALKKIAAPYSDAERDQMFRGTAADVYRLDPRRPLGHWSRGLGRRWRRLCTPPPSKGRSMTANSVLTHRNVGVLAVNAVEAPEVVTSQLDR